MYFETQLLSNQQNFPLFSSADITIHYFYQWNGQHFYIYRLTFVWKYWFSMSFALGLALGSNKIKHYWHLICLLWVKLFLRLSTKKWTIHDLVRRVSLPVSCTRESGKIDAVNEFLKLNVFDCADYANDLTPDSICADLIYCEFSSRLRCKNRWMQKTEVLSVDNYIAILLGNPFNKIFTFW